MNWYFFSFAKPEFAGAIHVQGTSFENAYVNAILLGANPEWHSIGTDITSLNAPLPEAQYLNRLLTKEELEAACGELERVSVCGDCASNSPLEMKARG